MWRRLSPRALHTDHRPATHTRTHARNSPSHPSSWVSRVPRRTICSMKGTICTEVRLRHCTTQSPLPNLQLEAQGGGGTEPTGTTRPAARQCSPTHSWRNTRLRILHRWWNRFLPAGVSLQPSSVSSPRLMGTPGRTPARPPARQASPPLSLPPRAATVRQLIDDAHLLQLNTMNRLPLTSTSVEISLM